MCLLSNRSNPALLKKNQFVQRNKYMSPNMLRHKPKAVNTPEGIILRSGALGVKEEILGLEYQDEDLSSIWL